MDETSWGIIALIAIAITVVVLIGFYKLCENVAAIRKILEKNKEINQTNNKDQQ
jgi:cell division protein FtsX